MAKQEADNDTQNQRAELLQAAPISNIGIVVPTSFELAPYLAIWPELTARNSGPWEIYETVRRRLTISLIVSYIGPANAAAATERLLSLDNPPQAILHGGAAGAIDKSLMPGDVVLGKKLKTVCSREILAVRRSLLLSASAIRYLKNNKPVHLDSLEADSLLLNRARAIAQSLCTKASPWSGPGWPNSADEDHRHPLCRDGVLGSQDGWTKNLEELTFLATTFGVDTEDMESAYVAQIAAKHGVPFLAIRVISNNEYIATLAKNEILPAVGLAAERVAEIICTLCDQLAEC